MIPTGISELNALLDMMYEQSNAMTLQAINAGLFDWYEGDPTDFLVGYEEEDDEEEELDW